MGDRTVSESARFDAYDPPARRAALLALVAVLAAVGLLFAPAFSAPATEQDEGSLLVYPERILEGDLPHRDFTSLYGPGGPWLLAGAFATTGPSLDTERAVGLTLRLVLVAGVFVLALPAGLVTAGASGLLCGAILLTTGLAALPAIGGLALAVAGLAALGLLARADSSRYQRLVPALIGLVLGIAVLFRYDFAPAVAVGALPAALGLLAAQRRWLLGGFAAAVLLYVPHLLLSWDQLGQVADDLTNAPGGRRLPLPGLCTEAGQLIAAQATCALLSLAAGGLLLRGKHGAQRRVAVSLLSGGLFVALLQPWVFGRADVTHVGPAAAVSVGLAPLLAVAIAQFAGRRTRARLLPAVVGTLTAATIALLLASGTIRGSVRVNLESVLGLSDYPSGALVTHEGRSFRVRRTPQAHAVDALLTDVARHSAPGERLVVGTGDLRRTSYSDTFLYYLLPDLEPGTFYLEFSPGGANRRGSGLDRDIARADVLILNRFWDGWNEPNESRDLGPAAPNDAVRRLFCRVSRRGTFDLYRRCDESRPPVKRSFSS